MFDNFDNNVLEILEDSKKYTNKHFKLFKIGTESLLYVMFSKEESITRFLLEDYRVTLDEISQAILSYVIIRSNNNEYTDKFKEVIEMSKVISKENNSDVVLEEHLLFALLVVKDTIFEALIKKLNLNSIVLIEDLKEYFYIKNTEELNNYSVNLTQLAKENKLNKLIGRDSYLHRMKVILERKSKNNILLVGSAGVGKTALVEGLCYELINDGSSYEVISVNVSSLIANTKYRGDFEARINKVLDEVLNSSNKILFIDEIHTIIGAGSSDNSLDIANIIKPYLARENFRCIGATTADEYEKSINKDKALARRFQSIFVNELTPLETIDVLNGIIDNYIKFHNVDFDRKNIPYIIKLCDEKITNRKFPDKAIDLMDEAMSLAKISGSSTSNIYHIDEALKNITGCNLGVVEGSFTYNELEPFFLDNYLGVVTKKNLVSINFTGDEDNLQVLLTDIKSGFGITGESILEINLANFNEVNSLSGLIGTPPGYIGYDDGGVLSEHYSKFIYQVIVIKRFTDSSTEIKNFITSMIENGYFYDKKGREFRTINSVFIFVNENKRIDNIGFISGSKTLESNMKCDLELGSKASILKSNPYIDSFKYKGFDISFNEDDFKSHQTCFKKAFLEIIRKYNHGKYFLRFNPDTLKIEVLNH